jgi:nucleotide-binding universal stress UspA family protein
MLTELLVPVDFSPHSAMAFEHAIELAKRLASKIHLVHAYPIAVAAVYPEPLLLPSGVIADLQRTAHAQLTPLQKRLAELGIPYDTHVCPGSPDAVILEVADALPADLIVMGTRGLTGLQHVMLGSVAERIVRLARCPVMTVKADL